jgi:hypothetical protein
MRRKPRRREATPVAYMILSKRMATAISGSDRVRSDKPPERSTSLRDGDGARPRPALFQGPFIPCRLEYLVPDYEV